VRLDNKAVLIRVIRAKKKEKYEKIIAIFSGNRAYNDGMGR
jgi:hypothetical protein